MSDKRLRMPVECAQVVIKYLMDGQPCENVFYVQKLHQDTEFGDPAPAAFDDGAAAVVADRVEQWLNPHWAAFAHSLASAVETNIIWNTVAGIGPLEGRVFTYGAGPIVGTNSGDALPNNCTIAVELRTGLLGRSFHGRMYVVGLNDGHLDVDAPNRLKLTSVSDIIALFGNLSDSLNNHTGEIGVFPQDRFPMGVMSFVHDGSDRAEALFTLETQMTLSDPFLDSMRRRLPAHNRHR